MIDPIVEYPNCNVTQDCKGLSITGGFIYRGSHGPWQGKYFFGDWSKQFGVKDGRLYVALRVGRQVDHGGREGRQHAELQLLRARASDRTPTARCTC